MLSRPKAWRCRNGSGRGRNDPGDDGQMVRKGLQLNIRWKFWAKIFVAAKPIPLLSADFPRQASHGEGTKELVRKDEAVKRATGRTRNGVGRCYERSVESKYGPEECGWPEGWLEVRWWNPQKPDESEQGPEGNRVVWGTGGGRMTYKRRVWRKCRWLTGGIRDSKIELLLQWPNTNMAGPKW